MAIAKLKQILAAGRRARVLIVDDSSVMRRLVALALQTDPCLEVIGTAQNGKEALERISKLTPDVVTMDIEMPEMDGLEALRQIRQLSPNVRVVMLSTLTERGASATLEALTLGADDYVNKTSDGRSIDESTARLRAELVPKIKQFFSFPQTNAEPTLASVTRSPRIVSKPRAGWSYQTRQVVAIGISTGGPTALAAILPTIPADFKLPVLIVQHMPPLFTKSLCERLQQRTLLPVREAIHQEIVKPGVILVAPGDYHMRVQIMGCEQQPRISLDQSPAQNSCRPAVDALFESVADVYGGAAVAAILTGMGHDGLRGARLLKSFGARILAQDEATSAVWGMPRAIVEAKLADAVLPLDEIVPQILRSCSQFGPWGLPSLQETDTCPN
jgi:two-component system chemotaxis response regulator CheB